MRKMTFLIALFLITLTLLAQTPSGFNYQAVVRNSSGEILANKRVNFRISIKRNSEEGQTIYSETHSVTTTAYGLVNFVIGMGNQISGNLNAVTWNDDQHFLRVELDSENNNNFIHIGTTQLLAVPYAFHAQTVSEINDNSVTSAKIQDGTIVAADLANSAVTAAKLASNAVTEAKISSNAVTSAKIADGAVTGVKIAQAGATSGQVLKWNGTQWSPGDDGGFSLPYFKVISHQDAAFAIYNQRDVGIVGQSRDSYGVYGLNLSISGLTVGVYGEVESNEGNGVKGRSYSSSGTTNGVMGESFSEQGRGVFGYASSLSGNTIGVYGNTRSPAGRGVYGENTSTSGISSGVHGRSASSGGRGVYGEASSNSGSTYGVFGLSRSAQGYGVYGENTSTSGNAYGVQGISASTGGRGVMGWATNTTGVTYGVRGISESSSGYGVFGIATNTSGITYGIKGEVNSASGFSGHFTGGKFYVAGRVGINSESPVTTLHVRHGTIATNAAPTEGLRLHNAGANNNSWTLYTVNSNGNLQIYANNTLRGIFSAASGTYTTSSNRHLKTDIYALGEDILTRTLQLMPVSYRYKSNPQSEPTIGFIAEDVLPLFPELVETTGENTENIGVNYAAFSVVAIKAIQQQQQQMDALQTENEQLKKRLEKLEHLVNAISGK